MTGIGDVEKRTGISRQNIRYYEKEGLLKPGRNPENSYRRYGDEDVKRLFQIKLLRKLGMPIGEIRRVLEGEVTLGTALAAHQSALKEERKSAAAFRPAAWRNCRRRNISPRWSWRRRGEPSLTILSAILNRWQGMKESGISPLCRIPCA